MEKGEIIYTKTDEAPALATQSLFAIVKKFLEKADIRVLQKDISLAHRILAAANDCLPKEQKVSDDLEYLASLCLKPEANIIKLPNISASVSQMKAAISELQEKGFDIPDFPDNPQNENEENIKKMYSTALGSAVNPVIREGNSDRRAAKSVKNYAKKHPYKIKEWDKNSRTKVLSMTDGDFFATEKSITNGDKETFVKFVFTDKNGNSKELRAPLKLLPLEILDSAVMSAKALRKFIEDCIETAKKDKVLFSFHLKATMMKVSDPIIFGIILKSFFAEVFEKHSSLFEEVGVNANNGLADLLEKIKGNEKEDEIISQINECLDHVLVAMVNSEKGISNFSVPSDTIIDASMPAMIKSGGKMWDKNGNPLDCLAIIPDRSYSGVYEAAVDFCKENGAFDPRVIGSVSNVGLMAKQAEEYGSHDKTFLMEDDGNVQIIDLISGEVLMEQNVESGDIFRACQTKHDSVLNWIKLAIERTKATSIPVVFWLDVHRPHDREIIRKLTKEIQDFAYSGLNMRIMSPKDACVFTIERMVKGEDTISASGNVLRDYLTDLFPIIELGTSAKMLSIVPLMNGGGLFETGAGGSAPKHVSQFVKQNFLRWDSLGEFMAIVPSLEKYAEVHKNRRAKILAETLDKAIENVLENQKSPSREPVSLDSRGSHFYLALYWTKALSEQKKDSEFAGLFSSTAKELSQNEEKILAELFSVQENPVDLGGYYLFDEEKVKKAMRPSEIFNKIIDNL